jgi:hypothetical protein
VFGTCALYDLRLRTVLLYDMSQFMGQQSSSGQYRRHVLRCSKRDVPAKRVGQCIDHLCRCRGIRVCMHPHLPEVLAEARLHKGASRRVQRLAWAMQHFVDDRRYTSRLKAKG